MPAVVPDVSFRWTLRGRAIHPVSELFAGFERRHTASLDLNRGAGLGIATGARGRLVYAGPGVRDVIRLYRDIVADAPRDLS